MNESILRALMRLFAIVYDINKEGQSDNKRSIVMDYLDQQYSLEIVQKYINFFDEQVHYFQQLNNDPLVIDPVARKAIAQNRIIELCSQINEELEHKQKIIVLVYLLDFIQSGEKQTRDEVSLVKTAASYLKISEDEFKDARSFTFEDINSVVNQDWLLVIRPKDATLASNLKQLGIDEFEGQIMVLHIPSADIFLFRYYGSMKLVLNGHRIHPGRSYIWSD